MGMDGERRHVVPEIVQNRIHGGRMESKWNLKSDGLASESGRKMAR